MKILVLGNAKQQTNKEVRDYYQKYVDFFEKSAKRESVDTLVETSLFDDLIIKVGDGIFSIYDAKNKRELSEYKALFIRGDALRNRMDVVCSVNEYAQINNIPIINSYSNVRDSSKLLQAVNFQKLGVPVALTMYITEAVLIQSENLNWPFPCVMKAVHGSHGNDNYVVHGWEDVKSHIDSQPTIRFVLQRFVPNDCDYRILVVGDEVLVIRRSATGGTHLNNTSKGGVAELVDIQEIPKEVMENVKKVMDSYGMAIAGVDVFADKNSKEFFFLEVNSQPQLMTGAYIEKKEELVGILLAKLSDNG